MSPSRIPTVCVVVSSNAEQYRVVDVTGAPNGSSIRERILSKLRIPDDRHANFSIYQSEIGCFGMGSALTNTRLFELCRDYGDSSGSLKFFVSTYPDRPSSQVDQVVFSPTYYSNGLY
ncbi:hypothetical protein BDZ94DRAFT_1276223 [Collybia nuda]|uniref:Ras-binding domain-containing protein n=1 Tax=Collybia nuda TaxID=64659 RepID=A0A9P5XSL1_9AGAR|nr:hypothetical protein BDZ94DRAFT_1276223 [Collybia nuda]